MTFHPFVEMEHGSSYNHYPSSARDSITITTDSFEISHQILFGEYKNYLAEIKKDSSYTFYLNQLPDSSITSLENYVKYVTDEKYNNYPVVGIRWDAAMNFCKWKTLKGNSCGSINYYYRLPKVSEWLAANKYLQNGREYNEFNRNYSDWTTGLYYEGGYSFFGKSGMDVSYFAKPEDPPRMKRLRVMGNNFLYQSAETLQNIGNFYSFNGYRHVAFRVVKVLCDPTKEMDNKQASLFKYWSLIK